MNGFLLLLLIAIGIFFLIVWLFKWLWNITMPDLFKLTQIKFWQAFRLILIVSILFCGFKLSRSGSALFQPSSAKPKLLLSGTVKDAKTGKPIEGAKVSDDKYGQKPYRGAVTDSEGNYIYLTWTEEHIIIATAPGYESKRKGLTTNSLQTDREKIIGFDLVPE